MTNNNAYNTISESSTSSSLQVGYYSAILTAVITIVTFGFALIAIPISGANCPGGCIEYPYLDTVAQFPRDYLWMPLAMMLITVYVVLMVSIHAYANKEKKIFSQIGLCFATIVAGILLSNYFIQFSVIPVSLMNAETDGVAILTQYNAHGIFIALEDLGYLIMSLSFVFMIPVFGNKGRLETVVRWVFTLGFVLAVVALVVISINHGLDRQDRFEVVVLSVDWLVLIVNGFLLSRVFRKQLKENENQMEKSL